MVYKIRIFCIYLFKWNLFTNLLIYTHCISFFQVVKKCTYLFVLPCNKILPPTKKNLYFFVTYLVFFVTHKSSLLSSWHIDLSNEIYHYLPVISKTKLNLNFTLFSNNGILIKRSPVVVFLKKDNDVRQQNW